MKINAIRISINTPDGEYGAFHNFNNGLNIVRGNNSTGKSTLFQSILYALGFEELLSGRNSETMQSVLKVFVDDDNKQPHKVLKSTIELEIENNEGQAITIKRYVKNDAKDPKLIEVCEVRKLTKNENGYVMSKYIHDKGGANNKEFGFHYYLAQFFGWELPKVTTTKGDNVSLYIQMLAPAFLIEQKQGWSNFMATMPYYGIKNAFCRVIDFLLNTDIFDIIKKKEESKFEEEKLKDEWLNYFATMQNIARNCGFQLLGMGEKPEILNELDIQLIKTTDLGSININEEIEQLTNEFSTLITNKSKIIGENTEIYEKEIEALQDQIKTNSIKYNLLLDETTNSEQQLKTYKIQLQNIVRDLEKNKAAFKVQKLGAEIKSSVAMCQCPTCKQTIKDSLLPNDVKEIPMRLEDNIQYLISQKKMIDIFIEGQEKELNKKKNILKNINIQLSQMRGKVRSLTKELVKDPRVMSEYEIEQKIKLQNRIEFFNKQREEFENLRLNICNEFRKKLESFQKYNPKDIHSKNDKQKIKRFGELFVQYLNEFQYKSQSTKSITISEDTYLPINDIYNIRFDSSASDFIRCIWAYTIALMQTSNEMNGNHPNLLMFDEPKQQDAAMKDFKLFLKRLSEFKNSQIIVFASFEEHEESFNDATNGIDFHLIRIKNKLITKINQQ
ncbi:MAG: hypothetical protein IKK68_00515 [Paludibacteraceae bacterium]|nr:hypothetical protein [Paludibacteraceae bacterium]